MYDFIIIFYFLIMISIAEYVSMYVLNQEMTMYWLLDYNYRVYIHFIILKA